ncbi:MAG: Asp-tRNA(Asn)/Glu-tRNA(Gln) amidotransferase subunit GatC [Patescibacteria group bacterium]
MLSKEEVQHIAKLARLGITSEEEGEFAKDLSSILDYIEKLKKVDVSNIPPASHAVLVENMMREDSEGEKSDGQKLLGLSPETKDGFLKVKSIFK